MKLYLGLYALEKVTEGDTGTCQFIAVRTTPTEVMDLIAAHSTEYYMRSNLNWVERFDTDPNTFMDVIDAKYGEQPIHRWEAEGPAGVKYVVLEQTLH